jgi:hypothetical protein
VSDDVERIIQRDLDRLPLLPKERWIPTHLDQRGRFRTLRAASFVVAVVAVAIGAAELINTTTRSGTSPDLDGGGNAAAISFRSIDVSALPRLHAPEPTVLLIATPEDVTLLEAFAEYGIPHGAFLKDRLSIDLDKEIGVVVLGGTRPCAVPDLTIELVTKDASNVRVRIGEPTRDPKHVCLTMVTYPSALAAVSRSALTVQPGLIIEAVWSDGSRRASTFYCGVEQRSGSSAALSSADRCRNAAPQGMATQLAVTIRTKEGDPLPTAALIYPSGASYVTLDSTADRFSSLAERRIWVYQCSKLQMVSRPAGSAQMATSCVGDGREVPIP